MRAQRSPRPRRVAATAVALACGLGAGLGGCRPDGDDYPINTGGDDTPWTPGIDAAGADAADAAGDGGAGMLTGRVCLIADVRMVTACAATGADGLVVSLGGQTTTTGVDGGFTLPPPAVPTVRWQVSGLPIVRSVMAFGSSHVIPAVPVATWEDLLGGNGVLAAADQGWIIARVVQGTAPVAGAVAVASPAPAYATFYDGTSVTQWDQDGTGAFGVAWLAGVDTGTVSLSVSPQGGGAVVTSVDVVDDSITFLTVAVP